MSWNKAHNAWARVWFFSLGSSHSPVPSSSLLWGWGQSLQAANAIALSAPQSWLPHQLCAGWGARKALSHGRPITTSAPSPCVFWAALRAKPRLKTHLGKCMLTLGSTSGNAEGQLWLSIVVVPKKVKMSKTSDLAGKRSSFQKQTLQTWNGFRCSGHKVKFSSV